MSLYVIFFIFGSIWHRSISLQYCIKSNAKNLLLKRMVGLPGLEPGMTESKPVVLLITP